MPTYCYRDIETDELHELFMTSDEMLERQDDDGVIEHEGRKLKRSYQDEGIAAHGNAGWPLVSTAAGVLPEQVKEERAFLERHGCRNLQFTKDGKAVFESRAQRRAWLRAKGCVDRDGGYGDG